MTPAGGRAGIIEAVQTPLGFFVLVVLIVEALLGAVGFALGAGEDRSFVIRAMIILIFALVVIVTGIAIWRPSILAGEDPRRESKYSLLIGPPEDLKNLDITLISWDEQCFLVAHTLDLKEKITLVPSRLGPTFRVEIPSKVVKKVKDEAVSLDLKDTNGNRWKVGAFYLFENLLYLSLAEGKEKITQDYGGAGQ
jgi:hypothetical protein